MKEGHENDGTPGGAHGDQSEVMPPQPEPGGRQEAVPAVPGMIPSVAGLGGVWVS